MWLPEHQRFAAVAGITSNNKALIQSTDGMVWDQEPAPTSKSLSMEYTTAGPTTVAAVGEWRYDQYNDGTYHYTIHVYDADAKYFRMVFSTPSESSTSETGTLMRAPLVWTGTEYMTYVYRGSGTATKLTSPDGHTWTEEHVDWIPWMNGPAVYAVNPTQGNNSIHIWESGGTLFAARMHSGNIANATGVRAGVLGVYSTSTDGGVTWSELSVINPGIPLRARWTSYGGSYQSYVVNDQLFVFTCQGTAVTSDMVTWTLIPTLFRADGTSGVDYAYQFSDLMYANGRYWWWQMIHNITNITSRTGTAHRITLYYSSNLTTWTQYVRSEPIAAQAVVGVSVLSDDLLYINGSERDSILTTDTLVRTQLPVRSAWANPRYLADGKIHIDAGLQPVRYDPATGQIDTVYLKNTNAAKMVSVPGGVLVDRLRTHTTDPNAIRHIDTETGAVTVVTLMQNVSDRIGYGSVVTPTMVEFPAEGIAFAPTTSRWVPRPRIPSIQSYEERSCATYLPSGHLIHVNPYNHYAIRMDLNSPDPRWESILPTMPGSEFERDTSPQTHELPPTEFEPGATIHYADGVDSEGPFRVAAAVWTGSSEQFSVYLSVDDGASWTRLHSGFSGSYPNYFRSIVAGTRNHIMVVLSDQRRFTSNGTTWLSRSHPSNVRMTWTGQSVSYAYKNDMWHALLTYNGVLRVDTSVDGVDFIAGTPATTDPALITGSTATVRVFGSKLIAVLTTSWGNPALSNSQRIKVYDTTDGTWSTPVSVPAWVPSSLSSLEIVDVRGGVIMMTAYGNAMVSQDGIEWTEVPRPTDEQVTYVMDDMATIHAVADYSFAPYSTTDFGQTWTEAPFQATVNPNDNQAGGWAPDASIVTINDVHYVVSNHAVYRTHDFTTYEQCAYIWDLTPIPDAENHHSDAIRALVHREDSDTLVLFTAAGYVFEAPTATPSEWAPLPRVTYAAIAPWWEDVDQGGWESPIYESSLLDPAVIGVCTAAVGGTRYYIAYGMGGLLATSTDLATWKPTQLSSPDTVNWSVGTAHDYVVGGGRDEDADMDGGSKTYIPFVSAITYSPTTNTMLVSAGYSYYYPQQ